METPVPGSYAYVSKQKVSQLADEQRTFPSGVISKLALKLSFVSRWLSGRSNSSMLSDLKRLVPKLQSEFDIRGVENAVESKTSPVFVSFEGSAARHTADGVFLLALESPRVALLLAGSASNAIGSGNANAEISPSADPVRSVLRVCGKDESEDVDASSELSYVWRSLMQSSIDSGATLPRVEGIAVLTARLPASHGQMERVDRGRIKSLVVGTPLYVRQVEAG
jgi:hypothetical protein